MFLCVEHNLAIKQVIDIVKGVLLNKLIQLVNTAIVGLGPHKHFLLSF